MAKIEKSIFPENLDHLSKKKFIIKNKILRREMVIAENDNPPFIQLYNHVERLSIIEALDELIQSSKNTLETFSKNKQNKIHAAYTLLEEYKKFLIEKNNK